MLGLIDFSFFFWWVSFLIAGNCKVVIEGGNFVSERRPGQLAVSVIDVAKINVSGLDLKYLCLGVTWDYLYFCERMRSLFICLFCNVWVLWTLEIIDPGYLVFFIYSWNALNQV